MSNQLRNHLHGFTRWVDGGGWVVLLIVVILVVLITYSLYKSNDY